MIISSQKMSAIIELLRKFGARRIFLFGSYLDKPEKANDLDLAVEGIPLNRLLDADVELSGILSMPFDLISSEENPDFFRIVREYGKVLYEEK